MNSPGEWANGLIEGVHVERWRAAPRGPAGARLGATGSVVALLYRISGLIRKLPFDPYDFDGLSHVRGGNNCNRSGRL